MKLYRHLIVFSYEVSGKDKDIPVYLDQIIYVY